MYIISKNTEAELAQKRAEQDARAALIELTANLLRIVRGAGKPHEVPEQVKRLDNALDTCCVVGGGWPFHELANSLLRESPRYSDIVASADYQIVSGALQIAASDLLGQRPQSAAGRREMHDGVRSLRDYWEEQRQQLRAPTAKSKRKPPLAAKADHKATKRTKD